MRSKDVARITLTVAATLTGLYALFLVRHVVLLVGVAAFLAVAMEPGIRILQKVFKSRKLAAAVMILVMIGVIGLFIASVAPPLARQFGDFVDNLPRYRAELLDSSTPLGSLERRFDLTDRIRSAAEKTSSGLSNLGTVLGRVGGIIADVLVVLALTVYFLLNLPKLKEQLYSLFPPAKRARNVNIAEQVLRKVGGWMEGNILISFIAGITSFAFLTLIGVPYAGALAMWVAIADLIPMVGATLGALVCVIVAFFSGTTTGLITLGFFAAYQQIENYVISPRVMKRTVDVSAVAVIIAALVGGTLLGVVGVLIAVPAAASLKVIGRELWLSRAEPPSDVPAEA